MKNDPNDRHLDQTDEEILTSDVSDEALEVAAGMGGTGPTASIHPETVSARLSVVTSQVRLADRKSFGSSAHEPPRTTWPEQSPVVRAVPSRGSPERFAFQQSSTHSRTLPCTWKSPNGLASEASVATVRRGGCALALPA